MEVVGHNLGSFTHGLDVRGVDREKLLRINGVILFLMEIRAELGGPINPMKLGCEDLTSCHVRAQVVG